MQQDNPFLNRSKSTKKEKRQEKRVNLQTRLQTSENKISKGQAKRLKAKAKQNLSVKIDDLLEALSENEEDNEGNESLKSLLKSGSTTTSSGYIQPKIKLINPYKNSRNSDRVAKQEIARFGKLIKDESFTESPFAALKQFISANIEEKSEFVKLRAKRELKDQTQMQL